VFEVSDLTCGKIRHGSVLSFEACGDSTKIPDSLRRRRPRIVEFNQDVYFLGLLGRNFAQEARSQQKFSSNDLIRPNL
jgi:hypothetical protein